MHLAACVADWLVYCYVCVYYMSYILTNMQSFTRRAVSVTVECCREDEHSVSTARVQFTLSFTKH